MTRVRRELLVAAAIVALSLVANACKGGSPTSPTPGGGGTTPPPGGGSTMTIDANGRLTPNAITVPIGSRVTIVNQHNRAHEMNSDPHPEHTDCPPINDVGFIAPGQTKLTGNLTVARTCGLHDHNEPSNENLMGTIRIQ